MADIAVTDEWVTTMFGDSLKNGLYIIFRVEGIEGIKDGFILKHYGVTDDNNDKLNLDIHGIVRSTSLENKEPKIKIDSNALMLGIEKNCKLSGMGFVKKGTGIRPFVDVTDGTDPNTIRKRLDNESTINNFFNHNIYDWFIKEKIREHIKDANDGDSNSDDDNECYSIGKLNTLCENHYKKTNNSLIELLNGIITKNNNTNDDKIEILKEFLEQYNDPQYLESFFTETFQQKNGIDRTRNEFQNSSRSLFDILIDYKHNNDSIERSNSENLVNLLRNVDNVDIIVGDYLTNDQRQILNSENTKLSEIEKLKTVSLQGKDQAVVDNTPLDQQYIIELPGKYDGPEKEGIKTYYGEGDNKKNNLFLNPDNETVQNINKLVNFFNGPFRYILSLDSTFKIDGKPAFESTWNKYLTNLSNAGTNLIYETLQKDLIPFFFVDSSYENKGQYELLSVKDQNYKNKVCNLKKIIEDSTYYINNPKKLFKSFFYTIKTVDDSHKSTVDAHIDNVVNCVHIADLIQIYYHMKYYLNDSDQAEDENIVKFETVAKVISNYFRDIKQNSWWTKMTDINNNIVKVNSSINLESNISTINDNKIITLLKVNNYSQDLNNWNITYKPYISNDKKFLKLKVQNYSNELDKKNFIFPTTNVSKDISKNSRTFTFGGFSHVFYPNQKPKTKNDEPTNDIDEMANPNQAQTKILINKIINGENVFIFGYGASGAGKTAMLIYNNIKNYDGYCIRLCKEIAKRIILDNKIRNSSPITDESSKIEDNNLEITLKLNIEEFHYENQVDKESKPYFTEKEFKYIPTDKNTNFTGGKSEAKGNVQYGGESIEENKEVNHVNLSGGNNSESKIYSGGAPLSKKEQKKIRMNYEYFLQDNTDKVGFEDGCKSDEFCTKEYVPLNFFLRKYVTDETKNGKRRIKPTRNNKQSSRSHVMIYIEFTTNETHKSNKPYGKLIVADLAGVENPFDSSDSETITETYETMKSILEEDATNVDDGQMSNLDIHEDIQDNIAKDKGIKLTGNIQLLEDFITKKYKYIDYKPKIDENGLFAFQTIIGDPYKYNTNAFNKLDIKPKIIPFNFTNNKEVFDFFINKFNITKLENSPMKAALEKKGDLNQINDYETEIDDLETKIKNYNEYITAAENNKNRRIWKNSTNSLSLPPRITDVIENHDKILTSIKGMKNGVYTPNTSYVFKPQGIGWTLNEELELEQNTINRNTLQNSLDQKKKALAKLQNKNNSELDKNYIKTLSKSFGRFSEKDLKYEPLINFMYQHNGFNKNGNIVDNFVQENWNLPNEVNATITMNMKLNYDNSPVEPDFTISYTDKIQGAILDKLKKDILDQFVNDNQKEIKKFIETNVRDQLDKVIFSSTKPTYMNSILKKMRSFQYQTQYDLDLRNKKIKQVEREIAFIMSEVYLRKKEGDYINDQLELLRKNMFDSMYYKTEEFLFTAPRISTTCASSICAAPGADVTETDEIETGVKDQNKNEENKAGNTQTVVQSNCFLMEREKINNVNDITQIFTDIITKYNYGNGKNGIINLFKSLNIVVFTVFNITEKISTSELSRTPNVFKNIGEDEDQTSDENTLRAYKEPTQFIDIENIQNEIMTYKSKDGYTKTIKDMFIGKGDFINKPRHISVANSAAIDNIKDYFRDKNYNPIIGEINKHNASTPLGTLFFTDSMAKFGKNRVCHSVEETPNEWNFVLKYIQNDKKSKEALNTFNPDLSSSVSVSSVDSKIEEEKELKKTI